MFNANKIVSQMGFILILCIGFFSTSVLAQQVRIEIQINNSQSDKDDYVTWGPTPCRIRATQTDTDLTVVLTNDKTTIPIGKSQPPDGDVAFAKSVAAGETATGRTLSLELPKDGSWVDFVVAGYFPSGSKRGRSSSRDKDTVIEVHLDTEAGRIVGKHRLMVRVRKNLVTITDHERHRLLSAIAKLHKRGGYEKFVEVHDWASRGDKRHVGRINHPSYSYPDTSHRDSNFLAWHRIDLLQFERELQAIHPDVSLHYWQLDHGDPSGAVFSDDMYGANEVDTATPAWPTLNRTPYIDFVNFARDNPLHGWRITYQGRFANSELLTRFPVDRTKRPWLLGDTSKILPGEIEILAKADFLDFADFFETETHNKSHHWMGPPMRDCTVAPADPFFWSFHSWFDRVWAKWQWKFDRFAIDGSNNSYEPLGKFDPDANPTHSKGHYLEDTMWPWDGIVGEGTHANPSVRYAQSRPPKAPIGKFPASSIQGLWPDADAAPKVADAIDYLGLDARVQSHGCCYDDIPFGVATAEERALALQFDLDIRQEDQARLATFHAQTRSVAERLKAINAVRLGVNTDQAQELLRSLKNERDPRLKAAALRLACTSRSKRKEAMTYAMNLMNRGEMPTEFSSEVLRILEFNTHFVPRDYISYADSQKTLKRAASRSDMSTKLAALAVLVGRYDDGATEFLRDQLKNQQSSAIDLRDALGLLAVNGGAREHYSLITPFIGSSDSSLSTLALLSSPITDENRSAVKKKLRSSSLSFKCRLIALHALSTCTDFATTTIELLHEEGDVSNDLKCEALSLLRRAIECQGTRLSDWQTAELQGLATNSDERIRQEIEMVLQAPGEETRD